MRVPSRSFLPFLFMSLLLPAVVWAGPVTGRVVDPDGRPVRAGTVLLVHRGTVVATTATDDEGRFRVTPPYEGEFEIVASVHGLRARPVSVRSDADTGTITLEVSAVRESVIVSAAHVDIPLSTTSSSVTVLTTEDLASLQVRHLADALRLAPGLSIAAAGGHGAQTSIFPRGGESDYSLVFIDGVQANAFGGGFDAAHVPLANVERIEIVRGSQSALYGSNAIGAVVRIVTRRGGAPVGSATIEGGSFGTSRFAGAGSGSTGPWQWGGAIDRTASDGVVQNDDYERWVVGGGLGWSPGAGTTVRADGHYAEDERGFPGPFGSDPGGTFSGIDTVARGSNARALASISASLPAGARVRFNGRLTHASIEGSQISAFDPERPTSITSRRDEGRLQADVTLTSSLHGSAGAELQRERATSTFITARDSREVPVERTLGGLFGEIRWNREARLFVTAGLRAERIARHALPGSPSAFAPRPDFDDDVDTSVNPKVGAAWFLRSSQGSFTKVRASAGTGIRPPDAFEIAFTDNPALKPERSRSLEAGLDQAIAGGRGSLEATAFYNRYDDLIVAVGSFAGSSRYRTDNISNARTRGVELAGTARARGSLRGRIPLDAHLRVALTLLDTEVLAVDGAAGAPPPFEPGDPLIRRPARQVSADVAVTSGAFSAFLTAGGRSRTRDVDPSFGTFGGLFDSPGYAVVNAGGGWRPTRRLELFGRVTNLFDRTYEEALGFPALGRAVTVGLRVASSR